MFEQNRLLELYLLQAISVSLIDGFLFRACSRDRNDPKSALASPNRTGHMLSPSCSKAKATCFLFHLQTPRPHDLCFIFKSERCSGIHLNEEAHSLCFGASFARANAWKVDCLHLLHSVEWWGWHDHRLRDFQHIRDRRSDRRLRLQSTQKRETTYQWGPQIKD